MLKAGGTRVRGCRRLAPLVPVALGALITLAGCGITWGSPGGASAESRSETASPNQATPSPALEKAVRDALATPEMERFIAQSATQSQWRQALQSPEGERTLERAVALALMAPAGQRLVASAVQQTLKSGETRTTIQNTVRETLMQWMTSGTKAQQGGGSSPGGSTSQGPSAGGSANGE
jgi:hypothetical protein